MIENYVPFIFLAFMALWFLGLGDPHLPRI